ncbi:MAG: 1-(5-phosphoribosyl)-5-amino-4-imidazole-carboxylate carboxylase [Candidatus Hydrogenedentota bacterium]|nr:MAG: 1-(5-phosphoribosyl)-5-amino-4-imidazole-carboxylate carboxylase [Candidatus Hydrogenedentota bacterium]
MNPQKLLELLNGVSDGEVNPEDALERLKNLPFEDLGFAKLDHHRQLRRGMPETIFGLGKTAEQVVTIVTHMKENGSNVLATRCSAEVAEAVLAVHPEAVHNAMARTISITISPPEILGGYVAVVCAGTSDLPVAEEAAVTCEAMGNTVKRINDIGVAGLHRVLGQKGELDDANVIVVCAGMEGALPSVVAGLVESPVIAVPTSIGYGASFGGIAALLGMLNTCAEGVSVVNIDNGFGAGINASLINRLANKVPA